MLHQLQVSGNGEDVHEVEEDVHYNDDDKVDHTVQVDIPHLPLFPGKVTPVDLQRAANTRHNYGESQKLSASADNRPCYLGIF